MHAEPETQAAPARDTQLDRSCLEPVELEEAGSASV
jgi:hypothetical protein